MTPTSVCQQSLLLIGAKTSLSSIFPSDGSTGADACAILYTPVITNLLRAAHWGFARKQIAAAQLKALYVNGTLQTGNNAPPTPWWFEYAYPSDCLKARFILNTCPQTNVQPPLTTGSGQYQVPQTAVGFSRFTPALDTDSNNNPVKVILTNQPQAQLVYTADLSVLPDLWDSEFYMAATAALAAYLVNPLARNAALMKQMVDMATGSIAVARATDGNEGLPSQDNIPDFIRIRGAGGGYGFAGGGGTLCAGWDNMVFPSGLTY